MEPSPQRDPRADLEARIHAGEFDAFLTFRGTATVAGQEKRARQGFMLSAYAARVACDPTADFSGFLTELWEQVRSLFEVGEVDHGDGSDVGPHRERP